MKPVDEWEEDLFREALRWSEGTERQTFLSGACAGDNALRTRLESLIQAHEAPAPPQPQVAPTDTPTVLLRPEEGPGTVISRYKLLEKIGEGGHGVVYVAEQREPFKHRDGRMFIIASGFIGGSLPAWAEPSFRRFELIVPQLETSFVTPYEDLR